MHYITEEKLITKSNGATNQIKLVANKEVIVKSFFLAISYTIRKIENINNKYIKSLYEK